LPVVGTIERLALDYGDLRLDLREPVAVTVHGKTAWSLAPATLQGDGGTLRLGGGVSPGKGYDIALGLSEVSSEFLRTFFADLPFAFRGLNLAGTLSGPLDAPEAALSGSVTEVWSPEEIVALAGQFAVRVSSRGIVVQTFSWTTKAGERIVLVGTAPYDPFGRRFIPGKLDLAGDFSIPDLGVFTIFLPEDLRMRGSLTGTLKISGTGPHPEAAINFHATDIRLPAAVVVRPPGPVTVEAEAVFKDNDLRIVKLAAYSKDFSVSVAGDWRAAGALLKGRPAAGLPGTLDLKATVMVGDIGWLGRGLGGIRRLGGHLAGTMTLAGPAASPDLTADISFAGGEFRAEGDMPPLRDIQAQLRIAQRTATIDRFTGTVGGSPFAVAGRVVLPGTGPPEADLRVHGANLLLYRSEGIKVRADTDITVRGTLAAPAFAGTIALTDSWLQKNVNWLEPLRDIGRRKGPASGTEKAVGIGVSFHTPPLRDATFDIHLLSKNPFRIKSNVARGRLRPDLRLRGTGEVPLLTGVIYVDSSRIMLPAGRLTVESGLIRLPAKNLGRPVLEISGASRIFGYDINVMVEGPYDDPVVTLSSVPPLPQDALLLLLLTGRLPPGLVEQAGGWQGGISVALYVSKGVLQEWFGGNDLDAEESRLERFDVVIGRGISRQGNETIGAQYRLADDVIKDGDELYLVAERDVYDEFNTGIRIVFKFQ
jgi:autotransporter translocation and assembly factor TamB